MSKSKDQPEDQLKEQKNPPALQSALDAIKKAHGAGAIISDNAAIPGVEFCSSQCIGLDKALGGGWARGRMIEIFGPESSGKTTLALHAVAQHQKEGRIATFIDMEHALDPLYAEALGVDMNTVLVSQPNSGEEALDILELLLKSGALGIIVLDSVAALVPKAEIEGKSGDSHMGLQARLMSQAMRKLSGAAHRTQTTVMWINQLRQKIGVVFGNPEVTTGGNALKFYASQRVDIRRIGGVKPAGKEQDETVQFIANRTKTKVVKNKVAPPFISAEFDIIYGMGIDAYADLLENAAAADVVEKAGSWYSFRGQRIGQGKANVCTFLRENESVANEIRSKL